MNKMDPCIRKTNTLEMTSSESGAYTGEDDELNMDMLQPWTSSSYSFSPCQSMNEEETPEAVVEVGSAGEVKEKEKETQCPCYGSISVIGRRRTMEDDVIMVPRVVEGDNLGSYDFYAVYDGHVGSNESNTYLDRLHRVLAAEVEAEGGLEMGGWVDWEKTMRACFAKMDVEEERLGAEKGGALSAVAVLVGEEEVVVANRGSSRTVFCCNGVAVRLSSDDKLDKSDEQERVEAAGVRIISRNGVPVFRVLSTSRSIGDHYPKPYVVSEPEVTITKRNESDNFLVIASDGLWDVLSNEVVCQVVQNCLDGQIGRRIMEGLKGSRTADAAAILARLAIARGSDDNISVIVVDLKGTVTPSD